jgi:hypothetical protein
MKLTMPFAGGSKPQTPRQKRRHLAERVESFMVGAMGVGAAVLLIFLLYSFIRTGTDVPSWMH